MTIRHDATGITAHRSIMSSIWREVERDPGTDDDRIRELLHELEAEIERAPTRSRERELLQAEATALRHAYAHMATDRASVGSRGVPDLGY